MNDKNNEADPNQNLSFSVMPKLDGPMTQSEPAKSSPAVTKPAEPERPKKFNPDLDPNQIQPRMQSDPAPRSHKWVYWLITIIILGALGAVAYYLIGPSINSEDSNSTSRLPRVFLQQHFQVETCLNTSTCGDDADPDNDGLSNYQEFVEQTNPQNPDSDDDGLADGDEVNIYLTDPTLKFTDQRPVSTQNNYNDGSQITNEYDPLTPGIKMTAIRKLKIEELIAEHGLHEPSITTVKNTSTNGTVQAAQTVTVFVTNCRFDPPTLTINTNDIVVWLNKDSLPRRIIYDSDPTMPALPDITSGILGANQTYSHRFTQSGTYNYFEESNTASKGVIIVTD